MFVYLSLLAAIWQSRVSHRGEVFAQCVREYYMCVCEYLSERDYV